MFLCLRDELDLGSGLIFSLLSQPLRAKHCWLNPPNSALKKKFFCLNFYLVSLKILTWRQRQEQLSAIAKWGYSQCSEHTRLSRTCLWPAEETVPALFTGTFGSGKTTKPILTDGAVTHRVGVRSFPGRRNRNIPTFLLPQAVPQEIFTYFQHVVYLVSWSKCFWMWVWRLHVLIGMQEQVQSVQLEV